jgi:hypothetical protein
MGTNCAPLLADLFLYSYDSKFPSYAGEAGILLHMFGKFMILKLNSSRLSYILVLSRPLSSNSRYKSKNDADEAVSVVSLTSSLPHDKLKTRLKETIHKAFSLRIYALKFVVLGYNAHVFQTKFKKVKHAIPRNK